MLVSIIIPTKNRCDLLRETLVSVVAQTYTDWEVIVIDDGSNDGTEEMVSAMTSVQGQIRFLRREKAPSGAAACRNLGVSVAKGELVVFLDSDDLLAPECLARRVKILEEKPGLDFAVFLTRIFHAAPGDSSYLINNFTQEDDLDRFLRLDAPWQTTGPIWRKASLAKIGPWDERALTMQDWEFHVRALAANLNYCKVAEIDSFWRTTRPASMTYGVSWGSSRRVWNRVRLYGRVLAILRAQGLLTERRRRLLAAEYYKHAFVINQKRRLAHRIWAITRREKIVNAIEYVAIGSSDLLFRFVRRGHELIVNSFLPEVLLKRTHFVALPPDDHE